MTNHLVASSLENAPTASYAPMCAQLSPSLAALRALHQRAARLAALGQTPSSIAAEVGWTPSFTADLLNSDPTFRQLVCEYVRELESGFQ